MKRGRLMIRVCIAFIIFLLNSSVTCAEGKLSENWLINSKKLGYPIQYRVYIPKNINKSIRLPVIYLTDGQWYLKEGTIRERSF